MKLWVDDERAAPDGWELATDVEDAIAWLEKFNVTDISLDHDLGNSPEDGYVLAKWMCYNEKVPANVRVHSRNPVGARNIANFFNSYGYDVTLDPYKSDS